MNVCLALYLHVPFCAVRCAYCDFNTYAGLERLYEPFVAALVEEIRRAGAERGRPPVRTVFIGGGTPTVVPPELLADALDACRRAFDVAPDAEITCEANPGTVDQARFGALRAMGINRLSLGVQSFDDAELRWLGRIHTAEEAVAAFHAARQAGFDNINLDFIFGLSGQRPEMWARTLERAVALGPEHLSLYSLTVEHGTPLYDRVRRGLADAPDDDLAADLYELACETLAAGGYEQYEISNWAGRIGEAAKQRITNRRITKQRITNRRITKQRITNRRITNRRITNHESRISESRIPPFAHSRFVHSPFVCRHNLVYWHREPYLGFGPGAHSFDGLRRWWNVKPVPEYIGRIEAGRSPERDGEIIDRDTAMGEFMMLGLRLVQEGVTDERFRARFGVGPEDAFGEQIGRLVAQGLLERLPDRVRLTRRGRLLGNRVFGAFL